MSQVKSSLKSVIEGFLGDRKALIIFVLCDSILEILTYEPVVTVLGASLSLISLIAEDGSRIRIVGEALTWAIYTIVVYQTSENLASNFGSDEKSYQIQVTLFGIFASVPLVYLDTIGYIFSMLVLSGAFVMRLNEESGAGKVYDSYFGTVLIGIVAFSIAAFHPYRTVLEIGLLVAIFAGRIPLATAQSYLGLLQSRIQVLNSTAARGPRGLLLSMLVYSSLLMATQVFLPRVVLRGISSIPSVEALILLLLGQPDLILFHTLSIVAISTSTIISILMMIYWTREIARMPAFLDSVSTRVAGVPSTDRSGNRLVRPISNVYWIGVILISAVHIPFLALANVEMTGFVLVSVYLQNGRATFGQFSTLAVVLYLGVWVLGMVIIYKSLREAQRGSHSRIGGGFWSILASDRVVLNEGERITWAYLSQVFILLIIGVSTKLTIMYQVGTLVILLLTYICYSMYVDSEDLPVELRWMVLMLPTLASVLYLFWGKGATNSYVLMFLGVGLTWQPVLTRAQEVIRGQ